MQIHLNETKNIPDKLFAQDSSKPNIHGFRALLADSLESKETLGHARTPDSQTGLILLGTVTRQVPTVSDLLYTTEYKEDCWSILAKRANDGKPFKSIAPGTKIFLDPRKMEIVWNGSCDERPEAAQAVEQIKETKTALKVEKTDPLVPQGFVNEGVSRFTAAVRGFLGKDYSQMDCYELLVGGLKSIGIQYQGKGGLGKHLMEKAVNKGFAYNHYLNGEGIVAASGKNLYQKRISRIVNVDLEADKVIGEIAPILKDGQILSFSTRTRGHTGVVARLNNDWTFINSGKMDNNLSGANGKMGVGEEKLAEEVRNWFRLAHDRGEGLMLSIGSMDMEKLAQFGSKKGGFTEKV